MELDCKKVLDLINEYIDGELDAADTEFVRSHIEKCPECKKVFDELKELEKLLTKSAETAPDALYDRVMDEVREDASTTKRKNNLMRKWGLVAVAAVICISVISTPTILMLATGGAKAECADNAVADVMDNFGQKNPTSAGTPTEKADGDQFFCTEEVFDSADEAEIEPIDSGIYAAYLINGEKITITVDTENKIAILGETKYRLTIGDTYCLTNDTDRLCFRLNTSGETYFTQVD